MGYKGSNAFISGLCDIYDICFVCEHWMKNSDISFVQLRLRKELKWSYFKTSIDSETVLSGRGYGGVGFICKQKPNISYRRMDIESDRILGLSVYNDATLILHVIGVYMPYFNGETEQKYNSMQKR